MEVNSNLEISYFDAIEKIVVKKVSLINLPVLTISHNYALKSIEIEDGDIWKQDNGEFSFTGSLLQVKTLTVKGSSHSLSHSLSHN